MRVFSILLKSSEKKFCHKIKKTFSLSSPFLIFSIKSILKFRFANAGEPVSRLHDARMKKYKTMLLLVDEGEDRIMTLPRRKVPRFRVKIRVHCLISQPDTIEPLLAQTENLSVKGMRIKFLPTTQPRQDAGIHLNTSYEFKIYIYEISAPLILNGIVTYSDQIGEAFGIKFSEVSRETEMLLSKFVTEIAMNNPELILSETLPS